MRISIESWNDRTLLYFVGRQRKGDENYCGNEVCTETVEARQVCGLDAALAFETIFSCVCFQICFRFLILQDSSNVFPLVLVYLRSVTRQMNVSYEHSNLHHVICHAAFEPQS